MRILFSAVLAASFAAVSLPALAQTAAPTPAKQKACKTLKEDACGARTDCKWSAPTDQIGDQLDPAIRQVADGARNFIARGDGLDRVAEANPLHVA